MNSRDPKMKRKQYFVNPYFKFYKETEEYIRVSRGSKRVICDWLDKIPGITYEIVENFAELSRISCMALQDGFELRDYQSTAVNEAISEQSGILHMSTGSGKSITALAIIARLGLKATIIVNRSSLLRQMATECEKFFGYKPGVVGDGEKDIKDITIATVQTLSRDKKLTKQLAGQTNILFVDECHMMVTDKTLKVIEMFNPQHLYGMTATMSREDGKADVIRFTFGDILYRYEATLVQPEVHVIHTYADISPGDYTQMIEEMIYHEDRNELIAATAKKYLKEGRKVLILTKRIAHSTVLSYKMTDMEGVELVESTDKERNEKLSKYKKQPESFNCIIGTTSLLAVGVDVPAIDTVIIACDMKGKALHEQSIGRGLRKWFGKDDALIVDFWDGFVSLGPGGAGKKQMWNPILHNQFKQRMQFYKSKEWPVKYIDSNTHPKI